MIFIEGPDGVGKTTIAHHLVDKLDLPALPKRVSSDSIAAMPWESYRTLAEIAPRGTVADRWEAISSPIYRQYGGSRTPWEHVCWAQRFMLEGLKSGKHCLIFLNCNSRLLQERLEHDWQPDWVYQNIESIVWDYLTLARLYYKYPHVYHVDTGYVHSTKIAEGIARAYAR